MRTTPKQAAAMRWSPIRGSYARKERAKEGAGALAASS